MQLGGYLPKVFLDKTNKIQFSYSCASVVSGVCVDRFQVHTPLKLHMEGANPTTKAIHTLPQLDDYLSIEPSQFCLWTLVSYKYSIFK